MRRNWCRVDENGKLTEQATFRSKLVAQIGNSAFVWLILRGLANSQDWAVGRGEPDFSPQPPLPQLEQPPVLVEPQPELTVPQPGPQPSASRAANREKPTRWS